jgi:acyl-CoA synthetase (NDP forming)
MDFTYVSPSEFERQGYSREYGNRRSNRLKVDLTKLNRAFNPRCVAVIGDRKLGEFIWLRGQKTFHGKLYSVQVAPETIEEIKALGFTNYASILDIPEPVDLAILCVPRAVVPRILDECIRKDVAAVHMFTAGYSETKTQEGIEAERLLKRKAEAANLHIIGPNCMGIYNPAAGIRQRPEQPAGVSGDLGIISQSGGLAFFLSFEANVQGIGINKSVSFGNGTILDSTDFLEYFAQDPEIKVVAMYLEGVKDASRFLEVLRAASLRKPVVIWKGGRTVAGSFAIASHTGSMAVPIALWNSLVRQHGGIGVMTKDELIATVKALIYMPSVYGNRVAVTGGSGGESVNIADTFDEAGLTLPVLTKLSYEKLAEFYSIIGGGFRNPVDTGNQNRMQMKRIVDILAKDANIDNLVLLTSARVIETMGINIDDLVEMLAGARDTTSKPVMFILSYSTADEMKIVCDAMVKFQEKSIPVFSNMELGARALRNALEYYRWKNHIVTNQLP